MQHPSGAGYGGGTCPHQLPWSVVGETISEEYHLAQLPPLRRALPLLQRLLCCGSGGRGATGAERSSLLGYRHGTMAVL